MFRCFKLIFQEVPLYVVVCPLLTINAYFLGNDVLPVKKCAVFSWQDSLMNRVIHRSWGERSENIFLDLFLFIFTPWFVREVQAGIQPVEIRSHNFAEFSDYA
jgi:hypothetical protein